MSSLIRWHLKRKIGISPFAFPVKRILLDKRIMYFFPEAAIFQFSELVFSLVLIYVMSPDHVYSVHSTFERHALDTINIFR
jgi:hypothetical protein